ncbi:uncharacterized protein LOC114941653 isoform X2 [Nylanderia fulva]|uniref:uncharacterized protein LOC114941653 isoform X2 n=1 Tax=Nylanderia fulva TaxID=613905 RepID=UPI0010FB42B0|nr:uncharacterized protein LOC114941653 isoform X2 [Nylanderia fulva]
MSHTCSAAAVRAGILDRALTSRRASDRPLVGEARLRSGTCERNIVRGPQRRDPCGNRHVPDRDGRRRRLVRSDVTAASRQTATRSAVCFIVCACAIVAAERDRVCAKKSALRELRPTSADRRRNVTRDREWRVESLGEFVYTEERVLLAALNNHDSKDAVILQEVDLARLHEEQRPDLVLAVILMEATRKKHRLQEEKTRSCVRRGISTPHNFEGGTIDRRYVKFAISTETTEEDMDINSVREKNKNARKCSKIQQLENITGNDNNLIEEAFLKIVYSSRGSRSYRHLKQLLLLYTQNILSSVESNVEFDPINLKNINDILIFFHLYWLDIKQEIPDHSSYLNIMSALLSIYIDMELKLSSKEIDVKIIAALYIYLNNSEEHIFRVLVRIKHMTERYMKICNDIFTKSFTNLKIKRQDKMSLNDVTYIRYLLVFKMWKKISDKNEKIDELAIKLLGPCMPKLRDELIKFVPSPTDSTNHETETLWLLKSDIDLKQMHEHFLLFEDQMNKHSLQLEEIDNSAYLQCIKIDQYGLESQTQMNLFQQNKNRSTPTSNQEVNRDGLNGFQNNLQLGNNRNKPLEKTYLQKGERRSFKSLEKITEKSIKKPKKFEIIDLTGDDESGSYKINRRKRKKKYILNGRDCLKIGKNKKQDFLNHLKLSNEIMTSVNTEKSSNRDSKSLVEKACLEHKPILDNKISEGTESYTSINNKSSLNNVYHIIRQKNEHLNVMKNQINNTCPEFVKESKLENHHDLSHMTYMTGNAIGSYNNTITQSKKTLTSQEESVMDTIPSLKMCQNDIMDQHSFKNETLINTNCNATQKSCKYCEPMPVVHIGKHIICMICNPLYNNEHIFVVRRYRINDISVMTCRDMHGEKKMQHPDKSNDNTVSTTTFTEDQKVESSLYNQHVNFDNVKMNDNDIAKYSEATMKEQQKSDCDPSILNDQVHFSDFYMSNNPFKIGSNAEIDYNLKDFSNTEKDINYAKMLNDCDKYVYVAANHAVDECIMAKSAEKRNYSDMYTASTTFMEDQIVHDSKHSENTIKAQQERNDCDISNETSNRYLFEHDIFNIDSIDMDSKLEFKTSIDMDDSISFSHQIKILETLNNVVSNETTEFLLSSKQSPFELDNIYTNTFLSEKDILCHNQNNVINSNVNPTFHLNTDNNFQ